jgi:hypothetical protein
MGTEVKEQRAREKFIDKVIRTVADAVDHFDGDKSYVCYMAMRAIVTLIEDTFGAAYCDLLYRKCRREVLKVKEEGDQ